MSDFDFFGMDERAETEDEANELELTFDFDYENLLNDGVEKNVKLCATIKPSDKLRRSFEENGKTQSTHICLLIDTSQSMLKIVDDTNAVRTGETTKGEDGKIYDIATGGISKLKIAIDSAKKIADMLREGDTLSCIAYNDGAKVIFDNLGFLDSDKILKQLDRVREYTGMNTNISEALLQAGKVLTHYDDALPKRVLFFTDGEPTGGDTESMGVRAGQILAKYNIAVESMGFGMEDVNFPFLQKISSFSGGITTLINFPDEFATVFSTMFVQSQSIIITNAKLVLKLTSGTRIFDYYRGTPDNVYLGNKGGIDEKNVEINLGQIEKNQMYKYYFNVKLPGVGKDYEGPINIMNAELHFYIPGKHNDAEQIIKINVPVNYTSDSEEANEINGEVNILFRLAEVKRFDEEREKAFNAGDSEGTIKWIKKIINVYKELQKPVEADVYTKMLEEYMNHHSISKVVINKATSSSSQAQETGILDDLECDEIEGLVNKLKRNRGH